MFFVKFHIPPGGTPPSPGGIREIRKSENLETSFLKELCDDLFFSGFLVQFGCQTPRGQVSSSSISFVSVRLTKKTSTFIDFFRDLLKVAPPYPLPLPPLSAQQSAPNPGRRSQKSNPARSRAISRDLARSRPVQTARPERALGTAGEPHRV